MDDFVSSADSELREIMKRLHPDLASLPLSIWDFAI